ncbi:MAG TPA: BCAM0308 family protein [Pyrinomonadaceae bacterium]|nr:BCAM0308 family protein [Pyrinomonadaceae bacterium]
MRSKKPYTNATFTKRVDHEAGRHHTARAMSEPAVCKSCGAIYANRRWTEAAGTEAGGKKHQHWRPSQMTVCPACEQKHTGEPRGFVFLEGAFFSAHHDEIEQLLKNEAARAAEDNPLARIMDWERRDNRKLTVTTTTEHLAQRLGHALEKAYGGKTDYDFSHENKLARVSWRRSN